jgi:hypothetical protein
MMYKLSEKKEVQIKPSQYGLGFYLKIVHHQPATKNKKAYDRWFNVSKVTWTAISVLMPGVEFALWNSDVYPMILTDKERLAVSTFK